MNEPTVTFFITTPRSGTQWLARALNAVYPDFLTAEHEPLQYQYAPRKSLRNPEGQAAVYREEVIQTHFARIHRILESRSYVEVGFSAWAAAPILAKEFGDRLRLVQLTRHPVRVAASAVTVGCYVPGERSKHAHVVLTPEDSGVHLKHYAERWNQLSPFEKNLFFWYEVHRYGQELETAFPRIFARYSFEDLIEDTSVRRGLADFLALPPRPEWDCLCNQPVDRFRKQTQIPIDPSEIQHHPDILELAQTFGYHTYDVAPRAVRSRYCEAAVVTALKTASQSARQALATQFARLRPHLARLGPIATGALAAVRSRFLKEPSMAREG